LPNDSDAPPAKNPALAVPTPAFLQNSLLFMLTIILSMLA